MTETAIDYRERVRAAARTSAEAFSAQIALRPPCPDWCMRSWCAVRPISAEDGRVRSWGGWHIGEIRTVETEYGWTVQVAVAASDDEPEPEKVGVYVRVASGEDHGDETIAFFTQSEVEALAAALHRMSGRVDIIREIAQVQARP